MAVLDRARPQQRVAARGRRRGWSRYSGTTFYLFVSPWVIGFLALTAAPLGYAFVVSLTNFDGASERWRWVGTSNYAEVLQDRDVWSAALRSFGFTALVVPLSVAGGLYLAVLLNRRLLAVGLFRAVFFVPSVVPVVATAIMWRLIFDRDSGLLNGVLAWFGVPAVTWLADPDVFYALVIVMLWGLGGGMVIMLAALQGVPRELEEAAVVDGASRRQVFWHVTVPVISPVIFFQVVTGIIATLQVMVQPLLLSQTADMTTAAANSPSSTRLFMVEVYREFFVDQRFGYGSAMLWVYFVVILLLTVLVVRSGRFWVHYNVEEEE